MNKIIFFLSLSILISACQGEEFNGSLDIDTRADTEEYLLFGIFAQECFGNCTRIFKIEDGQIFMDDVNWGIPEVIPFLENPLDNSKYELAKHLIQDFPDDLLQSSQRTYGCPDCGDQGGFYLELLIDGTREIWLIDRFDDEQNQPIIDFKNELSNVLQQL